MTIPIVFTGSGQAVGAAALLADLLPVQYQLLVFDDPTRYIARLTAARPALIIVDGGAAEWRFWTTTPKTSPATRRIPIVLLTADAAQHAAGLRAGADLVLSPDALRSELPTLLTDVARVPDAAYLEQLDCECAQALPPRAREGVARFNAGEYYQQHDLFEAQWVETEGPVRDLYRAILQVGVAYYQIERGNLRGALKMLQRSVQWLAVLPDTCQGVDVAKLRADSTQVRAELERRQAAGLGLDGFDKTLIQGVRLVEV